MVLKERPDDFWKEELDYLFQSNFRKVGIQEYFRMFVEKENQNKVYFSAKIF